MSHRETDLHRITTLLGQCLGRIDEQAYRMQRLDDEDDAEDHAAEVLEDEAATLQELVGTLIDNYRDSEQAELNRILERSVDDCLDELGVPLVVRKRLTPDLPAVASSPGQLAFAVRRALMLCLGRIQAGGELLLTTRREGESVMLELETSGLRRDRHLHERAATLCEFVDGFQGNCHIDVDERGALLIALELPTVLATDEL